MHVQLFDAAEIGKEYLHGHELSFFFLFTRAIILSAH